MTEQEWICAGYFVIAGLLFIAACTQKFKIMVFVGFAASIYVVFAGIYQIIYYGEKWHFVAIYAVSTLFGVKLIIGYLNQYRERKRYLKELEQAENALSYLEKELKEKATEGLRRYFWTRRN